MEGLSGDGAIKYAINKVLSTSFNVKSTTVGIKVNQEGITLTDYERRYNFTLAVTDDSARNLFLIIDSILYIAALNKDFSFCRIAVTNCC